MKKWKKLASAAMAAMMCAALLTGCGGEKKQADSGDTIKVGAAFELTGAAAPQWLSITRKIFTLSSTSSGYRAILIFLPE